MVKFQVSIAPYRYKIVMLYIYIFFIGNINYFLLKIAFKRLNGAYNATRKWLLFNVSLFWATGNPRVQQKRRPLRIPYTENYEVSLTCFLLFCCRKQIGFLLHLMTLETLAKFLNL